ncbi:MAG TPA: hypothetical protein VF066_03300 [Thermoleophilaceae bacterium]
MRFFVTCVAVAFAAVLVGLMAMSLAIPLGLWAAFVVGVAVAGAVGYVALQGRMLTRGRAFVVAGATAVAAAAAPFAAFAGLSAWEHRENVRRAERLCWTDREQHARFASFDACVDAQTDSLDSQD